jgi:hypothetical protein
MMGEPVRAAALGTLARDVLHVLGRDTKAVQQRLKPAPQACRQLVEDEGACIDGPNSHTARCSVSP